MPLKRAGGQFLAEATRCGRELPIRVISDPAANEINRIPWEDTFMQRAALSATVLSVLLFSGVIDPAHAEEPTFAKLQSMCRNDKDPRQQGYCSGFVEAIALRIVREDKDCAFLQEYVDHANADLALADLIGDLNPADYPQRAFEAVEKFFHSKGCS
ncbi:MAG: hypothetical protein AAAC47_22280 [Pararhizobium sp.]